MRFVSVMFLCLFLGGCFHHPGGIAPSTKPLNSNYTVLGKVSGEDCVYHLLGIIPLSDGNELKDAIAAAMNRKPTADALIEVTADAYFQWWILFTRGCTQVHGTAVQSK